MSGKAYFSCGHDEYSILAGPDGFEFALSEIEDRTWERDGKPVVDELNKLHRQVAVLRDRGDALWFLLSRIRGWNQLNDLSDALEGDQIRLLKEEVELYKERGDYLWFLLCRLQNWSQLSTLPKDLEEELQTALVDYRPGKEDKR
jgi:hypothetical protein